jgi:hypothetical protein
VRHARQKRVAAVCAHQLRVTQTLFQTAIPADVKDELSAVNDEPSADHLASQRRWHHELASSVRGLPRFGACVKVLREVLLPSPLPALYVHRKRSRRVEDSQGKK